MLGFYNESDLIAESRLCAAAVGTDQLAQLRNIAACDKAQVWRDDDHRDMAQWVAINLGVSNLKARRMVTAAHALNDLPRISEALASGVLSLDKVLELCRFATPADEQKLISWAKRVGLGAIRDRADEATRIEPEATKEAERSRYLDWFFEDKNCMWLEGRLPAAEGHRVATVLDSIAKDIASSPEDGDLLSWRTAATGAGPMPWSSSPPARIKRPSGTPSWSTPSSTLC